MVICTNCKHCNGPEKFWDADTDEWFISYECKYAGWLSPEEVDEDLPCDCYEQNVDDN